MALPDVATFTEFAALAGFRRSYVTQLRKDDRLVLDDRGRVLVAQTQERIKATADPSKAGVSERHAANRRRKAEQAGQAGDAAETAGDDDNNGDEPTLAATNGLSYQTARAVKEHYQAMAAKRDYEVSMERLLNAEDVRQAVLGAVTTLRSRLETMPDTLGPQVAAVADEGKARAILADAMQHALAEVARDFHHLAGVEGGA